MVTMRHNPIVDTQKIERNPSVTLKSYQITRKKQNKGTDKNDKQKMAISTYCSTITLNINELNVPIKRYKVTEQIKKQHPSLCCLQETHFISEDTQTKNEEMMKDISYKIDVKTKADTRVSQNVTVITPTRTYNTC